MHRDYRGRSLAREVVEETNVKRERVDLGVLGVFESKLELGNVIAIERLRVSVGRLYVDHGTEAGEWELGKG